MFDAGEMDRNKDLRGFDKGQIVEGEGRVSLNRQGLLLVSSGENLPTVLQGGTNPQTGERVWAPKAH